MRARFHCSHVIAKMESRISHGSELLRYGERERRERSVGNPKETPIALGCWDISFA